MVTVIENINYAFTCLFVAEATVKVRAPGEAPRV
jgi:hypothetical protein